MSETRKVSRTAGFPVDGWMRMRGRAGGTGLRSAPPPSRPVAPGRGLGPWLQACRGWRRDGSSPSCPRLSCGLAAPLLDRGALHTTVVPAMSDTCWRDRCPAGVPGCSQRLQAPAAWTCLRLGFLGAGPSLALRSVRASGGVCAACGRGPAARLCLAKARGPALQSAGRRLAVTPPCGTRRSELVAAQLGQ